MAGKSPWEARVGKLLDPALHPEIVYSFKPYDSSMYGGQPRLDWLACDRTGRFIGVEVKHLDARRKSINLEKDLTAGQINALNAISRSAVGIALLAVGREKTLYLFDWHKIQYLLGGTAPSLLMISPGGSAESYMEIEWTGKHPEQTNILSSPLPLISGVSGAPPPPPLLPPGMPGPYPTFPAAVPSVPIMSLPGPILADLYGKGREYTPAPTQKLTRREQRRKLLAEMKSPRDE
jgi:hypothetical protein